MVARAVRDSDLDLTDDILDLLYHTKVEPTLKKEDTTPEVRTAWKDITKSLFKSMKKGDGPEAAFAVVLANVTAPIRLVTNLATTGLVLIFVTVFSLGALTGVAIAVRH